MPFLNEFFNSLEVLEYPYSYRHLIIHIKHEEKHLKMVNDFMNNNKTLQQWKSMGKIFGSNLNEGRHERLLDNFDEFSVKVQTIQVADEL